MDSTAHLVPTHTSYGTVAPWPPVEHQCQDDPPWVGHPAFGVLTNAHRSSSHTGCQGFNGTIRIFCSVQKRAQQEEEHSATCIARSLRSSCDAFTDFPCRPHVAGEVRSTMGHGTIPRRNCRDSCVSTAQRGRRSGEIRYHLGQQTLEVTTKETQTSALTALPTGPHGSMPCCHQATMRFWWAGTQLTVAPSGHLRRGRTGVERSETVGYSSPPLRASAPAAQWAAAKPSRRQFINYQPAAL